MRNAKLSSDEFMREREQALTAWPTGKDAEDLDRSFGYHAALPPEKRFAHALELAVAGTPLLQPRAGVALIEDHVQLLRHLQNEGEADLLPTTIDSYTRHNRYADAQRGIEESVSAGRSMLNGLPVVNHGVGRCREIIEALDRPVQVRHGTPDARLLAEISYAAGFTAFEGGGISYNIPYAKNIPLEKSIRDWQYIDRLTGLYAENGIVINREPFGPLTGTLVPPCISNAVAVLETLLAAEQGVKDVTVGYGQCGNMYQDVAAVESLRKTVLRYLEKFGYGDVRVSTVLHQWMGGFPKDEAKAYSVIAWGTAIGVQAQATKIITKSPHEALGVPTAEANANGLKASRQAINLIKDQVFARPGVLEEELRMIDIETEALLETVLSLGEGDVALGAVRAFAAGALDVPFAPSRVAPGMVFPARDNNGAVRFLEFGKLPFGDEIRAFHRKKLDERAVAEARGVSFQMTIDDIYAISKGRLVGRPAQKGRM